MQFFKIQIKKAHWIPISILALVIILMFWRVIFCGETFVDAATLQNQLPWGATGPTFLNHLYNRRDITDTYITREYFLVDSYRKGELPLWSPYNLCGYPIYADGVLRMLSPFNVLYLIFDISRAYDLTNLLQLFLTGLFSYLFLINLKLRKSAALVGSITFIMANLTLFHLTSSGWLGGLMWLPLIFLTMHRTIERRSTRMAILAGLCFGLQLYCGYMANTIYYLGAVISYYFFQGISEKTSRKKSVFLTLKYAVITLSVGFAISAAHWLPIFELLKFSNRKIVPTELAPNWLPPWYLITAIFPDILGNAYDTKFSSIFVGIGVSHAHSIYFGIASLFLFCFAIYLLKLKKVITNFSHSAETNLRYFLFLTVLSIFVMCAAPLYVHITKYIPVLQTIRVINRISVLLTFSIAVLTAYGLHYITKIEKQFIEKYLYWAKCFVLLVVTLTSISVIIASVIARTSSYQQLINAFEKQRRPVRAMLAISENFDILNWNNSCSTILSVILMILVLTLFTSWCKKRISEQVFIVILLTLITMDLAWNGTQFNKTYDRSLVYHENATTKFLQSDQSLFRVLAAPANFRGKGEDAGLNKIIAPPNTLVPYKIQTITGKDQLFPRWYREASSTVEPQNYLSHVVFNSSSSKWYDFWNVKYVITQQNLRLPYENYVERFVSDGIRVYENLNAKPRAFFIPQAIAMPETSLRHQKQNSISPVVRKIKDLSFDPLETAYVQGNGAIGEIQYTVAPTDFVKVTNYKNNEVDISAKSNSGGVLILTDTYYPGWNVYVDGIKDTIWRADHAFRAVKLNPGQHKVSFRFEPKVFQIGCWISIVSIIGILSYLLVLSIRKRTVIPQLHK